MRMRNQSIISGILCLLLHARADPDPIEDNEDDPAPPGEPPAGGHWASVNEALDVCRFTCTRAYAKCDIYGCSPMREVATMEGCRITCCGDTSRKYCWSCMELKPGESPPPPPSSCLPSEAVQKVENEAEDDDVKNKKLLPPKNPDLPNDPMKLYAMESDHYEGPPQPPKPPSINQENQESHDNPPAYPIPPPPPTPPTPPTPPASSSDPSDPSSLSSPSSRACCQ